MAFDPESGLTLLAGGIRADGAALSEMRAYDLESDRWMPLATTAPPNTAQARQLPRISRCGTRLPVERDHRSSEGVRFAIRPADPESLTGGSLRTRITGPLVYGSGFNS